MEINILRFEGWLIICPHCKHKHYVDDEDIAFNPMDDDSFFIRCEKCGKKFEVYYYD